MSVNWASQIGSYFKGMDTVMPAGSTMAGIGDACQAAVERTIGRTFEVKDYVENYDGNGRGTLFLRHDPVRSVASVTVSDSALSDIAIEATGQGIVRTSGGAFTSGIQNVTVSYSAGLTDPATDSPPPDLVLAVTYWAAMFFKDRDRIGLSSEVVGLQTTAFTRIIPPSVVAMIASWRRVFLPC